jgi:hypothetical protein
MFNKDIMKLNILLMVFIILKENTEKWKSYGENIVKMRLKKKRYKQLNLKNEKEILSL